MSHSKERAEKICLNCGTSLINRYCQNCGQENTEPEETLWTLISHFFNDITHFDGKFFSTGKYLITKPGFLSSEYLKGRRASYLHPIRMYVFTSAFFFIIFFALVNPEKFVKGEKEEKEQLTELTDAGTSLKEKISKIEDPVLKAATQRSIVNIDAHAEILRKTVAIQEEKDSIKLDATRKKIDSTRASRTKSGSRVVEGFTDSVLLDGKKVPVTKNITISGVKYYDYRSKIAYDSVQKELPAENRDGFFAKAIVNKLIIYRTKYKNDEKEASAIILERLMHTIPQALFVSLPFFALILMILYARRRYYYAHHAIFAIHLYCAFFLILLVFFGVDRIQTSTGWGWLVIIKTLLVLSMFFYLYKAMRNFYKQRRAKTIMKFILLNFSFFLVVLFLFCGYFILSIFQFN